MRDSATFVQMWSKTLYNRNRRILENVCISNCSLYESMTIDQKFIFILSNENPLIIKQIGKFVTESITLREKLVEYFFSWIDEDKKHTSKLKKYISKFPFSLYISIFVSFCFGVCFLVLLSFLFFFFFLLILTVLRICKFMLIHYTAM